MAIRDKNQGERYEPPLVELATTPAPPATILKKTQTKKNPNPVLLNQADQIRGVSYFALAEKPTRVADRVSTLIKSWDSLVLERHPTRSQPALIYRGLKNAARAHQRCSNAHAWARTCECAPV